MSAWSEVGNGLLFVNIKVINIEENQGQNPNKSINPNQGQSPSPNQGIEKKTSPAKVLGIIALVLSIIGLLFSPLSVISLVLAIIALVKSKGLDDGSKTIAIIALVISALSVIFMLVLAIGFLAFFGVLNPGTMLPAQCEFTSGFDCTEAPYGDSSAGTIMFPITNSNGYEISNITLDSSSVCKKAVSSTDPLANGASAIITLSDCSLFSGERFYEDVVITYVSVESGFKHTVTGLVSGKAS